MLGRLFEEIGRCFQLIAGLFSGAAFGFPSALGCLFGFEELLIRFGG